MVKKYALRITEPVLDLIQYLNSGPVLVEDEETFYLFTVNNETDEIESTDILVEDALYDENGHLKDPDLHIV